MLDKYPMNFEEYTIKVIQFISDRKFFNFNFSI